MAADSEFECDPVDLQGLIEESIVNTDIEQLALSTLYVDYQVQAAEKRAAQSFYPVWD